MRVLVATDAWHPQVNGVVRTLSALQAAAPRFGAEISFITPQGLPSFPLPTYPDIRCAIAAPVDDCKADRSGAAGRDPYRDRGHDRACGAALLPAARHPLHLELPYPACGLCRRARADPGKLGLAMAAALSRSRRTRDGIDADADFGIVAARLPKSGAVAARRRRRSVRAARGGKARSSAADLPHGRPRGGREKSRGVPVARPAGQQGGGRRRADEGRIDAALSGRDLSRRAPARRIAGDLCGRRCFRVSEPHRYLRPGDAGSAGLRSAGGGLSGAGPARCDRGGAGRCAGRGSARRCAARAYHRPQPPAAPLPSEWIGTRARGCFSTMSRSCAATRKNGGRHRRLPPHVSHARIRPPSPRPPSPSPA